MEILFVNHFPGGLAKRVTLPEGATIRELLAQEFPGVAPLEYRARLAVTVLDLDTPLCAGDSLYVTPTRIFAD